MNWFSQMPGYHKGLQTLPGMRLQWMLGFVMICLPPGCFILCLKLEQSRPRILSTCGWYVRRHAGGKKEQLSFRSAWLHSQPTAMGAVISICWVGNDFLLCQILRKLGIADVEHSWPKHTLSVSRLQPGLDKALQNPVLQWKLGWWAARATALSQAGIVACYAQEPSE